MQASPKTLHQAKAPKLAETGLYKQRPKDPKKDPKISKQEERASNQNWTARPPTSEWTLGSMSPMLLVRERMCSFNYNMTKAALLLAREQKCRLSNYWFSACRCTASSSPPPLPPRPRRRHHRPCHGPSS